MKNLTLIFVAIFATTSVFAQSKKEKQEKAESMAYEAVQLMDNGNPDAAIELLEEAQKLDPKSMDIPYEMGYAYLMKNDAAQAIKQFKPLLKHKDVNDRVYTMLGNSYDINGQPDKAIATYDDGLKKFPNSGTLHLERGNMHLQKDEYNEAMAYYEKGIEVDPNHSSNYYRAAKIYFMSNQKIWGMIYAELFILMNPGTDRSIELSGLLYDCYQNSITITSDTSSKIDFCENIMTISDINDIQMPYCMTWGAAMSLAVIVKDTIDLPTIDNIRSAFISNYYSMGSDEEYPNILYDYRKGIEDAGLGSAYNHYILSAGAPEYVQQWATENEDELKKLGGYFAENPFVVNDKHRFYRKQYPGE